MASLWGWCMHLLILISITSVHSETKVCSGSSSTRCSCSSKEACTLQCLGKDSCKDRTLMCLQHTLPCTINCDSKGQENACENAELDAERASNLTVNCDDSQSCISTHIYCPVSPRSTCSVLCSNSGKIGKSCYGVELHCGSGPCLIECESGTRNDICDNVKVHVLPSTVSFRCLNSKCAAIDEQIMPFSLTTASPTSPPISPTQKPVVNWIPSPTAHPTTPYPSTMPTLAISMLPPTVPVLQSTSETSNAPTQRMVLIGDMADPDSEPSVTGVESENVAVREVDENWLTVSIVGGVTMVCLALGI